MAERAMNQLPSDVMRYLDHVGKTVVAATVDSNGWPNTAPVAWILARDRRTIRMAVEASSSTLQNVYDSGKVALFFAEENMAVSIKGQARVLKEPMHSVPFPTALVEVAVDSVEDKRQLQAERGMVAATAWDQRRQLVSDSDVERELMS